MSRYIVAYKGLAQFKHSPHVKRISETTAKRLEGKGEKVYNSKSEAEEHC